MGLDPENTVGGKYLRSPGKLSKLMANQSHVQRGMKYLECW